MDTDDPYLPGDAHKHVAVVSTKQTLIALEVSGSSCNLEFPSGTIVVVDFADKDLIDGKFYVFRHAGEATLKRWRSDPPRLEPFSTDPVHDTIFPKHEVEVVGRITDSIRHY